MRLTLAFLAAALTASPALAAGEEFFSLRNSDFVVLIAFLLFLGVLLFFRVPTLIAGMLDKRAEGIRAELNEARALREEAQSLLASYERKQKEVQEQADRIVSSAKQEAQAASEQARKDLDRSVARRMTAAEEQIESARAAAVKEVRDEAIVVAVAAAREVIAKQMSAADRGKLIDDAIAQVDAKLH